MFRFKYVDLEVILQVRLFWRKKRCGSSVTTESGDREKGTLDLAQERLRFPRGQNQGAAKK